MEVGKVILVPSWDGVIPLWFGCCYRSSSRFPLDSAVLSFADKFQKRKKSLTAYGSCGIFRFPNKYLLVSAFF